MTESLEGLLGRLEEAAVLLRSQLPHRNLVWMRGVRGTLDEIWEERLGRVLEDVRRFENSGMGVTWPRTARERRSSRHTLGLELASARSHSSASEYSATDAD